ncbi:uncharacterized protein MONOS_10672 [Monocercomonoides exilis]|uniref:uncharacterized protein n=1 Tax=Monocercomonoides exilis TaxID=2049356 RepID=UPI00355A5AAD|nr:hypothetical protein MONOS_10672 [Monocercomonoides exilis]|eukprot:MONOS_10672.1-p1 / transcript=MONOS_10672.1 / gene=MONOS_10672 / organism=Monocercomonoides_exilis_PA203 / gene_product=unspecified product / transcript_product=unspecified product / location=Mono_scaffold00493:43082-43513(+) / protein_length=144 / sequence_SO=supercontig / SO=protein_coding / is_pseudo=false
MPTAAAIALISAPLPPIYEELTLSLIPAAVSSSMLSLCHHRHTNRERVPDLLCTVEVFGLPQLAPISLEKTLTSFDAASALNDSNVATQDASHVVSSSSSSSSSTSSSSSSSSSSFSSSIHLTTFMPSAHRPTPADVISHSYL